MSLEQQVADLTTATNNLTSAAGTVISSAQSSADAADTAQTGAETAESNAASHATTASGHVDTAASHKAGAEAARDAAEGHANNAAAVVSGGEATFDPAPGMIPLADANGHIHGDWVKELPALQIDYPWDDVLAVAIDIPDAPISGVGRSWGEMARPSGRYLGQYADETAARTVAAGDGEGDWYADSDAAYPIFYELSATTGQTEIFRAGDLDYPAAIAWVAWNNRVVGFDLTKPGAPMWRVRACHSNPPGGFTRSWWYGDPAATNNTRPPTAIAAKNGFVAIGVTETTTAANSYGLLFLDYPGDRYGRYDDLVSGGSSKYGGQYFPETADPSATDGDGTLPVIADKHVEAVALTILPDAPIDPVTGFPLPTIAVRSEDSYSIIRDDGDVVDITGANSVDSGVAFAPDGRLLISADQGYRPGIYSVPEADSAWDGVSLDHRWSYGTNPQVISNVGPRLVLGAGQYVIAGASGLILILDDEREIEFSVAVRGAVARITDTFTTGYQFSQALGCWLCNAITDDKGRDQLDLTENGTLTLAAIATDAELQLVKGFTSANYLSLANADTPDVFTGEPDFYAMGWAVCQSSGGDIYPLLIGNGLTDEFVSLAFNASGEAVLWIKGVTDASATVTGLPTGEPVHWHLQRINGDWLLYLNGRLRVSGDAGLNALSPSFDTDTILEIGHHSGTDCHADTGVALIRLGLGVVDAEHVQHVYEQERRIVRAGSKCLIDGTTGSIQALDQDGELLRVYTDWGRSSFLGLQRVGSEATPVGASPVSASSGGLSALGGADGLRLDVPANSLRKALVSTQSAQTQQVYWDDGDATTEIVLPVGWKPVDITLDGVRKRPGSAEDWVARHTGLAWAVLFTVATGTVDIGILAERED